MARKIVTKTTQLGQTVFYAGDIVDDLQGHNFTQLEGAGAALVSEGDSVVAARAVLAREARKKGAGTIEINDIMIGAVAALAVAATGNDLVVDQGTWYVNRSTGSDTNDGAALDRPLRTLNEFFRRMRGRVARVAMTVNVQGDIDAEGLITALGNYPANGSRWVTVIGSKTSLRTGTFTAGTVAYDHNPAGGITVGQIVDSALPAGGWAAAGPGGSSLVGKRVRLTSGANAGSIAWILGETVPRTGTVSPWWNSDLFTETTGPAVGDAYAVEDLSRMEDLWVPPGAGSVGWYDFDIGTGAFGPAGMVQGTCFFERCKVRNQLQFRGAADVIFVDGCFFSSTDSSVLGNLGATMSNVVLAACAFMSNLPHFDNAFIDLYNSCVGFGNGAHLAPDDDTRIRIESGAAWGLIGNGLAIDMRQGTSADIQGFVWASALAGGAGIKLDADCRLTWTEGTAASARFYLTGATTEFNVGGDAVTIAELGTLGYVNLSNGAMAVPNAP